MFQQFGGKQAGEGVVHDGTGYAVAPIMLDHVGAALGKERKLGVGQASDLLVKGCKDIHDVRHIDMGEPFAVAMVAKAGGEAGRVAVKGSGRSVEPAAIRVLHDLNPAHEPGIAALGELGPDPVGMSIRPVTIRYPSATFPWVASSSCTTKAPKETPAT